MTTETFTVPITFIATYQADDDDNIAAIDLALDFDEPVGRPLDENGLSLIEDSEHDLSVRLRRRALEDGQSLLAGKARAELVSPLGGAVLAAIDASPDENLDLLTTVVRSGRAYLVRIAVEPVEGARGGYVMDEDQTEGPWPDHADLSRQGVV
jgi:hypothetical protein